MEEEEEEADEEEEDQDATYPTDSSCNVSYVHTQTHSHIVQITRGTGACSDPAET